MKANLPALLGQLWLILLLALGMSGSTTSIGAEPGSADIVDWTDFGIFTEQWLDNAHSRTSSPGHDVTKTWSIKNGLIRCEGRPAGYMRTDKDYANYLFHVEWRWPGNGGNNGVLVHMSPPDTVWPKSLECQLHSTNAGDFWVIGGMETKEHAKGGERVKGRRTIKLKDSSEKPLGQWNAYDIICRDDWVVVLVNGVLQNVATGCSASSGKICLQSEGMPIEYRNVFIEPLE